MAESSLSLTYSSLQSRVARKLGYPTDSADRSTAQQNELDDVTDSGVRQFYYPPPTPNFPEGYQWSFLRPEATLTMASETSDYDLPDNYGSGITRLVYNGTDQVYDAVRIVPVRRIRELRQHSSEQGFPREAAVVVKEIDETEGQRYQILFWPEPDANYSLKYQYTALPSQLSDAKPYPLGGMLHAETILQSCLAAAEHFADRERGLEYQAFLERLEASIRLDLEQGPQRLGRMGGEWNTTLDQYRPYHRDSGAAFQYNP